MTLKLPENRSFFCMDCNNFRTPDCPTPDRGILSNPAENFCPQFDDMYAQQKKPQSPRTMVPGPEQPDRTPAPTPIQLSREPPATQPRDTCPKCHQLGFPTIKEIPDRDGHKKYPYHYFGHYDPSKASKLRWCYIGKKLPE